MNEQEKQWQSPPFEAPDDKKLAFCKQAIDLNQLKAHFGLDAIQKAINSFIRDGGLDLPGVLIEQRASLNIR